MSVRANAHRVWEFCHLHGGQERNEYLSTLRECVGPAVPIPTAADSKIVFLSVEHQVLDPSHRRWNKGVFRLVADRLSPILERQISEDLPG